MTESYTGILHTEGKTAAVLIDIDGVLCHIDWDCEPYEFNWEEFKEKDKDRETLWQGVGLARMMIQAGLYPVFLTARHEGMREQTEEFLAEIGMHGILVMASEGSDEVDDNYQQTQAYGKEKELEKLVKIFCFVYAIDDQEPNCEIYREFGIPVLRAMFTDNEFISGGDHE